MSELLDLETKLTILANNPCACVVCAKASRFAKHVLMDVAPSASKLLDLKEGTPEFKVAEQTFHDDELARLKDAYDTVRHGRCMMVPLPEPVPVPPPRHPEPEIPSLPDPEAFREKIEFYRRNGLGPRMQHRRKRRVEPLKNPLVPGSYLIK